MKMYNIWTFFTVLSFSLGFFQSAPGQEHYVRGIHYFDYRDNADYDLAFASVDAEDKLPNRGESLVVVALVGSKLHIRVFDSLGVMSSNRSVDSPAAAVDELKALVSKKPLPDENDLSEEDRREIVLKALNLVFSSSELGFYRCDRDGLNIQKTQSGHHNSDVILVDSKLRLLCTTSILGDGPYGEWTCIQFDGRNPKTLELAPVGSFVVLERDFQLDQKRNEVYYLLTHVSRGEGRPIARYLYRMDLKTNQCNAVASESLLVENPTGFRLSPNFAFDEANQAIYMTGFRFSVAGIDNVEFSSLEIEPLSITVPGGSRVDPIGRYLYSVGDTTSQATVNRVNLDTLESESVVIEDPDVRQIARVEPVRGTDTLYFVNQQNYGLYQTNFRSGEIELILGNRERIGGAYSLEQAPLSELDANSPVVALNLPSQLTVDRGTVDIDGTAIDDTNVTRVAWTLNGRGQGVLDFGLDGRFAVSGIRLIAGENRIRVSATDVDRNVGFAEIVVFWDPDRQLSLGDTQELSEGDLLSIPLTLQSNGDVSGMTLRIFYDPDYLSVPFFKKSYILDGSFLTVDTGELGSVAISLGVAGGAIPAGATTIGELMFRARSVPETRSVIIESVFEDSSDFNGDPLSIESAKSRVKAIISRRTFSADVNTNGYLDVGDVFLIQRLLVGLESIREWDHVLNDLNGNGLLDSGDLTKVLRTVIGALPQPMEPLQTLGQNVVGPSVSVTTDKVSPSPGEKIIVRVMLPKFDSDIGGVSFTLKYPSEVLRLESTSSHRAGELVPAGAVVAWNMEPLETDYANQSGTVSMVASDSIPWPNSCAGGEVAVFQFVVQSGFESHAVWPLVVDDVKVATENGYVILHLLGDRLFEIGRPVSFDAWKESYFTAEECEDPAWSGWLADPDGDGESNGQEYFQGTNPTSRNGFSLTGAIYSFDGEMMPMIGISRAVAANDAGYQLQISNDLETWKDVSSVTIQLGEITESGIEELLIGPSTDSSDFDSVFLRLVFFKKM